MTKIKKRSYGVDVASYQSTSVQLYAKLGAKYVITKISQSTNYLNPNGKAQIASTKANGLVPMAYFYATFSANSSRAQTETNYAIRNAKEMGLPAGSYFGVDRENGSGNICSGSTGANTSALIKSMTMLRDAGYKPLLYSGAAVLRNNVDIHRIIKLFGDCLWVASYKTMGSMSSPDFGYFPSMDGIAIWQFTSKWHGYSVDGNITLIDLDDKSNPSKSNPTSKAKEGDWEMSFHPVVKWNVERVFVVTNKDGANVYETPELAKSTATKKYKTAWQVFGEKDGAIQVGKNQYFDGRAGITKSNPIAKNDHKHAVVKVMMPHTHALKAPKADAEKAYALKAGTKYEVVGRVGRFLQLKTKDGSKRYVTGNRAFVVL